MVSEDKTGAHPAISFEDVSVSYGGLSAVDDVNFCIKPGEVFGLIGLNGAGKTTLLKALLDLRTQNKGAVSIFGKAVSELSVKKRLAFLPERFEPSWFLSGIEFLKFSASLYDYSLSDAQCIEAAQRISLDPQALKRRVQTYSKGMRQKLGLLGTVLTGCDLLILDEPMSGLDPVARVQVKELLFDARSRGCTVFMSSHILSDMDEVCDRVAVLHERTIQFTGTPEVLKKQTQAKTLERGFLQFIEPLAAA